VLLVGWQEGHPACKKHEWWDAGVVMYLDQGAYLRMAQLMSLPFTISCSSKSRLVLPFWCWLTWVVPDKIQEGHKTVVCVLTIYLTYSCFYARYNRLEVVRQMRWDFGSILPPDIKYNLSEQEVCYSLQKYAILLIVALDFVYFCYTVFHKIGTPLYFFNNFSKC